jgi:hypothetical protein
MELALTSVGLVALSFLLNKNRLDAEAESMEMH